LNGGCSDESLVDPTEGDLGRASVCPGHNFFGSNRVELDALVRFCNIPSHLTLAPRAPMLLAVEGEVSSSLNIAAPHTQYWLKECE
jgi:hypothetical protein